MVKVIIERMKRNKASIQMVFLMEECKCMAGTGTPIFVTNMQSQHIATFPDS